MSTEKHRGEFVHTDHRLAVVFYVQCTFTVSYQERQVEHVLDGLREVVRVDDETEEVDFPQFLRLIFQQVLDLCEFA